MGLLAGRLSNAEALEALQYSLAQFDDAMEHDDGDGAAGMGLQQATLGGAGAIALGIGLQNAREGAAIALPLRADGMRSARAWWYGQLSAVVELVAAVIGAAGVLLMRPILPYALTFAVGAMIFVVVEEVMPESHGDGNTDAATLACRVGFAIMMTLDVALG